MMCRGKRFFMQKPEKGIAACLSMILVRKNFKKATLKEDKAILRENNFF